MQGMIADTGEEWRLFEQRKTLAMITEYLLHDSPAMKRRIIFIDVASPTGALAAATDDFAIDVIREPRLFVDVHLHTGEVLQVKAIPSGSGWGTVPTPVF